MKTIGALSVIALAGAGLIGVAGIENVLAFGGLAWALLRPLTLTESASGTR